MHQDGEVEPVLIGNVVVQASKRDSRRTAAGLQVAVVIGYEPRDVWFLVVLLNGDGHRIKAVERDLVAGKRQAGSRIIDDAEDCRIEVPLLHGVGRYGGDLRRLVWLCDLVVIEVEEHLVL